MIMCRVNSLIILFTLFLLVSQVNLIEYGKDLSNTDVFQVTGIDVQNLRFMHVDEGKTEFGKLNDFLEEQTDSKDPDTNLDIILERLILDLKSKIPADSRTIHTKKLLLSLGTLNKDNECSYYGYKVISSNFEAIGTKASSMRNSEKMRRIDEILAHYLKRHIDNCKRVYYKNFDEISKNGVDKIQMKRVDTLFDGAIDNLTSDEQFEDHDTNYVERLYHMVRKDAYGLQPSFIHEAIKKSARGEPDKLLKEMGGGRTGMLRIGSDKLLEKLFDEYVKKPCRYFRQQFGPNVFEPISFISKFDYQLQYNKVDFYEAWLKYQLCNFDGSVKKAFDRLNDYLEHNFG